MNIPRVYTAEDRAIVSPNSDTPHSMIGMDLRGEPLVFTVIVGPTWTGPTPAGVDAVFRSETSFAMAVYRTQLFNPDDLDNVKKIQAGYQAEPLSSFLGEPPPPPPAPAGFVEPLTPETQKTDLGFFTVLSFILSHCPVHPSEADLRARFAEAGFDGDTLFDPEALSPEDRAAMEQGMANAWAEFATFKKEQLDTKKVAAGDIFGTHDLRTRARRASKLQSPALHRSGVRSFALSHLPRTLAR